MNSVTSKETTIIELFNLSNTTTVLSVLAHACNYDSKGLLFRTEDLELVMENLN